MAHWTCDQCGVGFKRNKSGDRPIRFCSQACYHEWNREHGSGAGRFPKGNKPWNLDVKGIHLSPDTEFKRGRESYTKAPIGSVRIRKRDRDGRQRAWVKVADPNVWVLRAVVVWEKKHGPLSKGMIVHHKDRNTLNDRLSNLSAITRAQHLAEHRPEFEAKRARNAAKARWG